MTDVEQALVKLGRALAAAEYRFVAVTPATHARVLARGTRSSPPSLRDVFGWSRPFARAALSPDIVELLAASGALIDVGDGTFRSAVRFASLDGALYVHSSYPTVESDAVFFGPDTYRFCAAVARLGGRAARIVDIGCGSGAGGLSARASAGQVVLADVNPRALSLARVNAALAGAEAAVEIVASDVLSGVDGAIDRVVANPPYLRDPLRRTYRDGGGALGESLSVRIVEESLARLSPGGTLLLYTGAAIVDGEDVFLRAVEPLLTRARAAYEYVEVDPDVFGEELGEAGYAAVDRIAAVTLSARVPAG